MKTRILLGGMLVAVALGCGKQAETTSTAASAEGATSAPAKEAAPAAAPAEGELTDLHGYYVGMFEASKYREGKNPSYVNKINVSIDQMGGGKVSGHSVVAGSSRPFSGTYTQSGDEYKVEVAEPGDDKYDGKFSFTLNGPAHTISGIWKANDTKLAVYERKYELERREFKYDPDLTLPDEVEYEFLYSNYDEHVEKGEGEHLTGDVLKFNASKVRLKASDVENMYQGDLEILRNSIYARHGYSFKTRKMRYVFDSVVDWYIPVSTDVSKELTKLEQDNIALIKRYEEHADTYYDSFGR